MQPKMCTKCKKNIAVVFITKIENGVAMNEGYCLRCARSLGVPHIDAAVKQMGFSEEDLDNLTDEMSSMFGQNDMGEDEDETESRTATFPMINQLFGMGNPGAMPNMPTPKKEEDSSEKNDNNQKKACNQVCKSGKCNHTHNFGSSEAPTSIKTITNSSARNNSMPGIIAHGKTDYSRKNPFPCDKFSSDIAQCQIIIR